MEFVIQDGFHASHDEVWLVYSFHHACPVCVACIAEVLEDDRLLPLQKKPALSEILRLLSQQQGDILQIFMHEERLVWHLLSILIGNLQVRDDTFLSLSIEIILKLIQQVKSEDLVSCVLDAVWQHVQSLSCHGDLLPHLTLLGKMVQYLPTLTQKLLTQYGDLLQSLSLELGRTGEVTQSAIAYIYIFLCEEEWLHLVSPRSLQLLQEGLLMMLTTAELESVQMNALGLLKNLLVDDELCRSLMALRKDNSSLLAALKKLLLSKRPVLQISVVQVLAQVLEKPESSQYGTAILESDITEFLFEGLHTQNTVQIESILRLLQKLAMVDQFYKRCHAVYGIESIIHGMSTARETKSAKVLQEGFLLLAEILNRQPCGIPMFMNCGLVRHCLEMFQHGLEQHQSQVFDAALAALSAIVRKEHLLLPVPLLEISSLVTMVTEKHKQQLSTPKSFRASKQGKVNVPGAQNETREEAGMKHYIRLMVKVCQLAKQCQADERSVESNFTAPGSVEQESSLENVTHTILQVCDETCIPTIMVHWDRVHDVEIHKLSLELLCLLYDIHPPSALSIVYRLTSAGFLSSVVDAGASSREAEFRGACSRFLTLVVVSCQSGGLLPAADLSRQIHLAADVLPWKVDHLAQAFGEDHVTVETVEAYLHVLYLCFVLGNRVIGVPDLMLILTTALDRHTSLQELSPLCRKHFLYLFAWASQQSSVSLQDLSLAVRGGLTSLLADPWETWYSHDVCLLQWLFSDEILAVKVGPCMVDAYLSSTTEEGFLRVIEDCTDGSDGQALLVLFQKWSFLSTLLESLACQSAESVAKVILLLEWRAQTEADPQQGSMLHLAVKKVTDVLHNVFLKNYPQAADHNVVGMLQVLLLLLKHSADMWQYEIDVKILYHVMNRLAKTDELSTQLEEACMLTLLVALSSCTKTDSHVCALVLQNGGVMRHLQACYEGESDTLYCITCDILTALLQHKHMQSSLAVVIHVTDLVQTVSTTVGATQVASLNLLAALFATDLKHGAVTVQNVPSETQYRSFLIHLQQLLVQEVLEVQEAAAECFGNMITHLHGINKQLAAELLSQPWNNLLVDVLVDKATASSIKLVTVVTSFDAGRELIRMNPVLMKKLETLSEHTFASESEQERISTKKLLEVVAANLEQDLPSSPAEKIDEPLTHIN